MKSQILLWVGLVTGYYYPTRRAGHGRLFSVWNGARLAYRAIAEK